MAGELAFDTDTKKLFVGDGSTAGGVAVDTTLAAQYLNLTTNIINALTHLILVNKQGLRTGYFNGIVASGEIEAAPFNGKHSS